MLYQLSYLGAAGPKGLRAPGYSQVKRACPPGYACGFARARPRFAGLGRPGQGTENQRLFAPSAERSPRRRIFSRHCEELLRRSNPAFLDGVPGFWIASRIGRRGAPPDGSQ
jgi:hypothetical protein